MSEKKKAREKDVAKENAAHSDLDELITETELQVKVKQLSSSMYAPLTQQLPLQRVPQEPDPLQAAHLGGGRLLLPSTYILVFVCPRQTLNFILAPTESSSERLATVQALRRSRCLRREKGETFGS